MTAASLAGILALFQPMTGIAGAASAGGKPSQVTSSAPQGNADFDPRGLPALPQVAGSGDVIPTLRGIVLDGSSTLSTSLTPRLQAPEAPSGAQVRYEIRSFANKVLWSYSTTASDAQVPRGVLRNGGSYMWTSTVNGQTSGQRLIEVDVQRRSAQGMVGFGGVQVTTVTGEPVLSLSTVGVGALPGVAGASLVYQPSNADSVDPTPGVPAAWRIESGSGWSRLQRFTDARFELSDSGGRTITFTRTSAGVWVPRFGPGRTWPAGAWVSLADGDGGRQVSATDRSGAVTTFPMPTAATPIVRATSLWSASEPGFVKAFDSSGRLTSVRDPASNQSVTLAYSGTGECPAVPAGGGFIPVPTGMLCQVTGWDGQRAEVAYSGTAAKPRIARITTQAQASPQALSQTDLGYDAVGRLASLRAPQANRAIAAGVLNGFGASNASDGRLLTSLTYDARGRVTRIQRPSAIISGSTAPPPPRGSRSLEYPAEGSMRVMVPHRTRAAAIHEASPATMLETRSIDAVGRVTTQSWDVARQVVTEARMPGGRIKRFTYDALGNARTVVGPTTTPDSPQAPRMTYGYDTKPICPLPAGQSAAARDNAAAAGPRCTRSGKRRVSRRTAPPAPITSHSRGAPRAVGVTGPVTEPMKGLQATFWSNREFSGTPTAHSTGPVAGASVPVTLRFGWSGSPTGTEAWSARLQGFLFAPATGRYVFRTGGGARLVVGDDACRPTCAVDLVATRPIPIRVDVTSSSTGGAALDVTWTGPDASGGVPTSVIRPGYPNPTRVATLDDPGTGVRELESLYVFDPATPTQVVESVSPSGAVQVRAYEGFNPAVGAFGRATTAQLAPGRTSSVTYYGGTEAVAPARACVDRGVSSGEAIQAGAPRSVTLTGGFASTTVNDASGRRLSLEQAVGDAIFTAQCNGYDSAGNLVRSVVPGTTEDDDVDQRFVLNVGGNPLVTSATSRTGGTTRTSTTIGDLLGRTISSTDGWGTVTVTSYDELDRPVYARSTTSRGQATETRLAYADDSQLRTVTVDGEVLATAEYSAATGDLTAVRYSNGARVTNSLGANLQPTERTITAGGKTMRETFRSSPAGRALDRSITAPGATASWSYRYDLDSRLVGARLAGSVLPAGVTAGAFEYAFDEQSRRTRTTAPGRDAIFAYDGPSGRMTSTSDPRFPGAFEYDSRGRATSVGPLRFEYGAGGQLSTITDTASGVSVSNILDGTGVIGQIVAGPGGQGGEVHYSAQGLMLRGDGSVAARIVQLPGGVSVQRFADGASTWRYADGAGNVAWEATGRAAPATTTLYDPDGNRLGTGASASLDPARPDLGWGGAGGMVTAPLSVATLQMGSRTYVPALATFLQPDPVPGSAATPYAYTPDPINAADYSGDMPAWASIAIRAAVATVVAGIIMKVTAGTGATIAAATFKAALSGFTAGAVGDAAGQGAVALGDFYLGNEITPFSIEEALLAGAAGAGSEGGAAAWAAFKQGMPLYKAVPQATVSRTVSVTSSKSALGQSAQNSLRSSVKSNYTADLIDETMLDAVGDVAIYKIDGANYVKAEEWKKAYEAGVKAGKETFAKQASAAPTRTWGNAFDSAYKPASSSSVYGELR